MLCILAFSATPAVAKSNHHYDGHRHFHRHPSRLYQAPTPQDDLTCLANTAYREARNSESNMQAVLSVARNRLISGWGYDYCNVVRKGRFVYTVRHPNPEEYAKAYEIARKVMEGELPDNTGGAMFFHAQYLRHRPNWARTQYLTARIGGNVFYRDHSTDLRVADNAAQPEPDSESSRD
jgi:spore germination cell wall hydrolase CwlJ-like protein